MTVLTIMHLLIFKFHKNCQYELVTVTLYFIVSNYKHRKNAARISCIFLSYRDMSDGLFPIRQSMPIPGNKLLIIYAELHQNLSYDVINLFFDGIRPIIEGQHR